MSARQELLDWVDQSFGDFTVGKPHAVVEQIKEIMWQIHLRQVERVEELLSVCIADANIQFRLNQDLMKAGFEINELSRELAEVRKDAQRYNWLRNQDPCQQIGSFTPYAIQGQTGKYLDGRGLDAAIDAAMSTPNKGESTLAAKEQA
jgi:hypothetical protein